MASRLGLIDEAVQEQVVVVDAVEQEVVRGLARAGAVDAGVSLRRQPRSRRRRSPCPAACVANASASRSLVGSVSSVWESKTVADRAVARPQRRRVRVDDHLLVVLAGRQRDRHDRLHRRQQPQVLQDFGLEPIARRGQRVAAGGQTIDREGAIRRGGASSGQAILLVDDEHHDVRDRRVGAVADVDQHRRVRGLREGRPRRRRKCDDAQCQAQISTETSGHDRGGLLRDDGALHAGGEVSRKRADERISRRLCRNLERQLDRLTRARQRRCRQHAGLLGWRDEIRVAVGHTRAGERGSIRSRLEDDDVMSHRDLGHRPGVLQHDVQGLSRLGRIVVTSYFIWSLPVIVTVRAPLAAAVAGAVLSRGHERRAQQQRGGEEISHR